MTIHLTPGRLYRVVARASVSSPLTLSMLKLRLAAAGFAGVTVSPRRGSVEVSGRYTGTERDIELAYDIMSVSEQ